MKVILMGAFANVFSSLIIVFHVNYCSAFQNSAIASSSYWRKAFSPVTDRFPHGNYEDEANAGGAVAIEGTQAASKEETQFIAGFDLGLRRSESGAKIACQQEAMECAQSAVAPGRKRREARHRFRRCAKKC